MGQGSVFCFKGVVVMRKTLKGFTLIEMGVVIVIISILTGLLVPSLQGNLRDAYIATDVSNAKTIYNAASLVVGVDDRAYASAFARGAGSCRPYKFDKVTNDKGEVIGYKTNGTATADNPLCMCPITRMDGCNAAAVKTYARLNGNGESGDPHNPAGSGNCIYTWENVADTSNKDDIRWDRRSGADKNNPNGHQYFTVLLSEKMNMPIWGDENEGGTWAERGNGKAVNKKDTYLRMRYIKHDRVKEISGDYVCAYRWFVTADYSNRTFKVMTGVGQDEYIYSVYPPEGVYAPGGSDGTAVRFE